MINYIKCFKVLLQDLDTETSATNNWSFYSLQHNKEEYGLWLAYAKAAIVINIGRKCEILSGKYGLCIRQTKDERGHLACFQPQLNGLHYRWHGVSCGFGSLHFWKGTLTTSWNKNDTKEEPGLLYQKVLSSAVRRLRLLHRILKAASSKRNTSLCCCHHIKNEKIFSLKHLQWPYFGHESVCMSGLHFFMCALCL